MRTSTILPEIRDLSSVIQSLQSRASTGPILSVYLNASLERRLGDGCVIAFQDVCKPIAAELESASHEERRLFKAAVSQVNAFLAERANVRGPGLAIFASGDAEVIGAVFPIPTADHATWNAQPTIEPLVEALDDCEQVVVVLFDKVRARLFSIYLDEIEERVAFVDKAPGDHRRIEQKRYENQREDTLLKHAKHTIRALSKELQTRPFDRLFIGGPDEAVSLISHRLPRPLRLRLAGFLSIELSATDAEVLKAAVVAAETTERLDELAAVQSLVEAETTPHVVLGCEPTLAALAQGRVHRLFVAAELSRTGARCVSCGRLTVSLERCPTCGAAIEPVADLGEAAVEDGRAEDASIEIVAGAASELLMRHGGLGARTRY